jgi:hypothetical protein
MLKILQHTDAVGLDPLQVYAGASINLDRLRTARQYDTVQFSPPAGDLAWQLPQLPLMSASVL